MQPAMVTTTGALVLFANHPWAAPFFAVAYFVSMFLATFSNVAFYHEIMQALNGQPVFIRRGFRFAATRWKAVLLWSLFAGLVGYGATKGALVAATRSLALELASEKVRVNCVCPGLVRTEMIGGLDSVMDQDQKDEVVASYPLGLGLPDDVAYAVAFLLAPAARWITGTAILLDGGRSA